MKAQRRMIGMGMPLRPSLLLSLGLLVACVEAAPETAVPTADSAALPDAGSTPDAAPDGATPSAEAGTSESDASSSPDAAPGGATPSGDAGTSESDASSSPDAGPHLDAGPYVALGMNDVTILAPLPASDDAALMRATDPVDDGTPLVPRALFDRLNEQPIDSFAPIVSRDAYAALQLVAVRFELCDRNRPGPCSETADGRLRLVLQPYASLDGFDDVGLHASFSIPAAEIPAVVRDLRALARIQSAPLSAPLDVNPALAAGNAAYVDALRALVRRIAGEQSFVRLTFNAQPSMASQVRWVMRGVEIRDGALADVGIPGIAGSTEGVITSGQHGFAAAPVSDTPEGMAQVIGDRSFAAANAERQLELLAVLAAAENPNVSATDTVSCVACHVSTQLTHFRTTEVGVDPTSIPGRYTSSYDLTVLGTLRTARTLRALGWRRRDMIISQRVVNDTAQLLLELQTRFPP